MNLRPLRFARVLRSGLSSNSLLGLCLMSALVFATAAHSAGKPANQADKAAGKGADAQVERLTDLMIEMVPIGGIFENLAKDDPKWPMQDRPDAVNAKQLACMRDELSVAGYRRSKRGEVVEYIARRPSQVDAEIKLLGDGAAALMGKLMTAGAEQERSGVKVSEQEIMGQATPEQLASFMDVLMNPDYADLRKLAGLGNAFGVDKSADENEAAGEQVGGNLAMQIMLRAMGTCEIQTSVLFDK